MKTLTFIRHAKSDWSGQLPDRQRPLNERGKRNAPVMGKRLGDLPYKPELIVVSIAERTQKTHQLLSEAAGWQNIPKKDEAWIYEAMLSDYIENISQLPEEISNVCFIGHNPTITFVTGYLSGEFFSDMPTCAVAIIDFEVDTWSAISARSGKLRHYDYPKNGSVDSDTKS